jgi:hypothetical protein
LIFFHVACSCMILEEFGPNDCISAASILLLYEAVKVQFSDPYKNVGRIKVLLTLYVPN